jgi:hypothetical protein
LTDAQQSLDSAESEIQSLRRLFSRLSVVQVTSAEYRQIAKATALSWFNTHRSGPAKVLGEDELATLDDIYRKLIEAVNRATLRTKYLTLIKGTKKALTSLQTKHAVVLAQVAQPTQTSSSDNPPSFSPLVSDPKMQMILSRRWTECSVCVRADAPLAAIVMMGGLLEGLLLAKINQSSDKSKIFGASAAPKDRTSGKALPLKDWGLKNFIDVAHELNWITKTTKDIGEIVRDYRNYIHPQKEFSHGIELQVGDAKMLWEVAKSIAIQLL